MNQTIETVVVGSSLTAASDGVVADALALARRLGARLRVVHAFAPPFDVIGGPSPAVWLGSVPPDCLTRDVLVALEAQMARAGVRREESAGCAAGMAAAHRLLVEEADAAGGALIVVGASEPGRRLPRLLGSTADRVLRSAKCPVLVRRGSLRLPPRRVIVPVDLSPLSAAALRYARGFLRQLGSTPAAELTALLILLPGRHSRQFSPEQIRRLAEEELERFVTAAADPSQIVHSRLRTGDPADEILAELGAGETDLAIMGSHGRGGFERHVLGSVAGAVAQSSSCSVLVVPSDAAVLAHADLPVVAHSSA